MTYAIFILIVLATVGFFNPLLVFSDQVQKLLFYMMFMLGYLQSVNKGRSLRDVQYPRLSYALVLIFVGLSAIVTTMMHRQSLMQSVITILPVLFAYAFFYIMLKSNIEKEKIIKFYLTLSAVSVFIYFANLATFPNNIFIRSLGEDLSRGILRVPVPFIEMFVLLLFYAINQINLGNNKKKWSWWIVLFSFMIILSVVRQIIALSFVLGIWFYFKNVNWFKKIVFISIIGATLYFVVPQIPVFKAMIELTEEQQELNEDEENVRIGAWSYFTYESQKDMVTPILGNGLPSLGVSSWGRRIAQEREDNGFFPEDVGWAGFYWYYGAIATAALLILLIKAAAKKKPDDEQYLTYWFIFIILTSIASGPILYYYQIVSVCVALYLVYKPNNDDSTNNLKLQQLSKHN